MNHLNFIILTIVAQSTLTVKSSAFEENGFIPSKYTCDGEGINPVLTIENLPQETKSMALVIEDPDAASGTFDHWVMWNIPSGNRIDENSAPGKEGKNSKKENMYAPPCPPSGTHHYHFKVYALDAMLELHDNTDKKALMKAMEGHILAKGELVGLYKK
jgi:Raf kinase inhibitor-like YbhB/YbcL family protein